MDQKEAQVFIEQLAVEEPSFAPMKDRALQLIANPNDIRQGAFFVCGLSAMVRSLLEQADLQPFADLLNTVFRNVQFRDIPVDARLREGRVRQWTQKLTHEKSLPVGVGYVPRAIHQLDFILARSLAKLLKIKARSVYDLQLMTSESLVRRFRAKPTAGPQRVFATLPSFGRCLDSATVDEDLAWAIDMHSWNAEFQLGFSLDPTTAKVRVDEAGTQWTVTFLDRDFENAKREFRVRRQDEELVWEFDGYTESTAYQKDGDLGLDPLGVEALMKRVLGARSYTYTTLAEAGDFAAINTAFDEGKPYVYAFVNGIGSWLDASAGKTGQFDKAAKAPHQYLAQELPVGEHLVAITDKITRADGRVLVPTWTWGTTFTADIPEAYLAGYIATFAWGHL